MKTVIGLFDNISDAVGAQNALIGNGIEQSRISVVTRPRAGEASDKTEAAEGAGIGATAGALAGGATGLLASLGALAIPGIGPLLAAGSIVAILTGAGIGAAAGGLIGGLIGMGIPEHEAELYSEGIQRGGTLLTVDANDNDADVIASVLSQHGAVDIDKRAAEWESTGWNRQTRPNPRETEADTGGEATSQQASRLPDQEAKARDALEKGDIGGPDGRPVSRGVDRADVASAGGTIGSIGAGMGTGVSDVAGTRRTARIYNP